MTKQKPAKESIPNYLDELLAVTNSRTPMLCATVDVAAHFPEGKKPFPEQSRVMDETAKFLADPSARIMIKQMPTGEGKSPVAAADSKSWTAAGGIAVIICPNKELQRQYETDFGKNDISIVTGGVEFKCNSFPGKTCGDAKPRKNCLDRKVIKDETDRMFCDCPYRTHQLNAALNAKRKPLCFTPHSFDAFRKNPLMRNSLPSGNGLIIVDEAHLLEEQLRDFLSISMKVEVIENVMGMDQSLGGFATEFFFDANPEDENDEGLPVSPKITDDQSVYLAVLEKALAEKIMKLEKYIESQDFDSLTIAFPYLSIEHFDDFPDHLEELITLQSKLEFILSTMDETSWVAELSVIDNSMDADDSSDDANNKSLKKSKKFKMKPFTDELEKKPFRLKLRPTVIPKAYLKLFFNGFSKIILMSGSLLPVHMQLLGLAEKNCKDVFSNCYRFQTKNSRIPASRRKIYIDNIDGMSVNYKNNEEAMIHFIDYILKRVVPKLPGEKGMIHVSSKKQAELVTTRGNALSQAIAEAQDLKHLPAQFITATAEKPWKELYREFKALERSSTNVFLVAARRYEGIDLKDDLSRICIMLKMPFPHTKDAMIKALEKEFPGYTAMTTFVSFIQGMNRAVRNPNDWALNICLDLMAEKLEKKLKAVQPDYIKEAITYPKSSDWIESWVIPDENYILKKHSSK